MDDINEITLLKKELLFWKNLYEKTSESRYLEADLYLMGCEKKTIDSNGMTTGFYMKDIDNALKIAAYGKITN